jgi:tetrapyrrole methylase family protein / MazG family protein
MTGGPHPVPLVTVVGLGPGPASLLPAASRDALLGADAAFLRTRRHPAAEGLGHLASFDHLYEAADDFDEVYRHVVEELVSSARRESAAGRRVVYGVPGSPLVAEATVALLLADPRVSVEILPAPSFLDLAWAALGVDPVTSGVQLVDGTACEVALAGGSGPFLVAQCWSTEVLSRLKLALDTGEPGPRRVVVLHHLGLDDQLVFTTVLDELDRALDPDHLTSVYVEKSAAPVAGEMARLDELVRTLRERCPWDREQTHTSLTRHLVEETYEVLDAIAELERSGTGSDHQAVPAAAGHLEEELGDLLFQVFFHSRLAAEAGWFTVADVAGAVHDKLVGRHPHVFGDVSAPTAGAVMANWERIKAEEKGRSSVTEGIPSALPALLLAAKLERKARALGMPEPDLEDRRRQLLDALGRLPAGDEGAVGAALYEFVALAVALGVDAEDALRAAAAAERERIVAFERAERSGP